MPERLWSKDDELHFKMGDMHGEVPVKIPEKPITPKPTKPPKDKPKYIPQKR